MPKMRAWCACRADLRAQVEQERLADPVGGRGQDDDHLGRDDGPQPAAVRVPLGAGARRGLAQQYLVRVVLDRPGDPRVRARQAAARAHVPGTHQ